MGYRIDRRYVLRWDGTDMDGAEVVIRATPIGVATELLGVLDWPRMVELLSQYVVRWNIEYQPDPAVDDWHTMPLDVDTITAHLEQAVALAIRREWLEAAMGITAPLGVKSSDGPPSPPLVLEELSIPMDSL